MAKYEKQQQQYFQSSEQYFKIQCFCGGGVEGVKEVEEEGEDFQNIFVSNSSLYATP